MRGIKCAASHNGVARGTLQSGRRKGSGGGGEVRQSPTELGRDGVERGHSLATLYHTTSRQQTTLPIGRQTSFSFPIKFPLSQDDDGVFKIIFFSLSSIYFTLFLGAFCALTPERILFILSFHTRPFPQPIYSLYSDHFRSFDYCGKLPRDIPTLLTFFEFRLSISVYSLYTILAVSLPSHTTRPMTRS